MKPRIKKMWIEALRSGEYEQGRLALNDGGKFCCLGVLCDLYAKEKGLKNPWRDYSLLPGQKRYMFSKSRQINLPPAYVLGWAGLAFNEWELGPKEKNLITMNDTEGKTFAEIADYVEANF